MRRGGVRSRARAAGKTRPSTPRMHALPTCRSRRRVRPSRGSDSGWGYRTARRDSGRIAAPSRPLSSRGGRQGQGRIGAVAKDVVHRAQAQGAGAICQVGDQRHQQSLGVVCHTGLVQVARLLPIRAVPREQVAQAAMTCAVHRIDQHRHGAAQVRTTADNQPDHRVVGHLVRADDAGQAVAVRDGRRRAIGAGVGNGECGGRAAQERGIRRHLQFDLPYPKTPCRNQLWEPVVTSSPSPWRKIQNRRPA